MRRNNNFYPTAGEAFICLGALGVWLAVTAYGIGFRAEHPVMALAIALLFFASRPTRKLIVALVPFFLFGISYDWMNLLPNYEVNPVDVRGIYEAEKSLFGITAASGEVLTPNEWFALHTSAVADFMAGVFYLCWVPLPIIFGLWLYFTGRREQYLHFAIAFLLVNLIGFAGYYIHPAAPPWYVAQHGFEAVPGTPGSVAGLGAFDAMTGLGIFDGLYARNSNVFGAFPSLHSAYTFVAFIYAMRYRSPLMWRVVLGIVTLGIWTTAVYTSHHYIIDVAGGIACSLIAVGLFELVLMHIPAWYRFMRAYTRYISKR